MLNYNEKESLEYIIVSADTATGASVTGHACVNQLYMGYAFTVSMDYCF